MIVRRIAGRQIAVPLRAVTCTRCLSTQGQARPAVEDSEGDADTAFFSDLAARPAVGARDPTGRTRSKAIDRAVLARTRQPQRSRPVEFERRLTPNQYLDRPPRAADVTLEMLMAAQMHMGHHAARWNPANGRYILGERQGTHIISLEQSLSSLRRAARVVEAVAYGGGLILFVGTRKPYHMEVVMRAAEIAKGGACAVWDRWVPGTITNAEKVLPVGDSLQLWDASDKQVLDGARAEEAARREAEWAQGRRPNELDATAQKRIDDEVTPLDALKDKMRPPRPDLVICLNVNENKALLRECGMALIPTIGIIDTDSDPTWTTYQIPGNDDSPRAMAIVAGALARAAAKGNARRRAAAKEGTVTWNPPREVLEYMRSQQQAVKSQVEEAVKQVAAEKGIKPEQLLEEIAASETA